jgi:hypothetical protein
MTSDSKTVLGWTYEPRGFFEILYQLPFSGGQISISDGEVRGEFDQSYFDQSWEFRDKVHAHVSTVFLAQQVQVHKVFTLSKASMAREHADGRQDIIGFLEPVHSTISAGSADIIVRNSDGKIIQDTKAERLKKQKDFRDAAANMTPNDPVLKRMLQSFGNALKDSENLLIHLYEIREALTSDFGGEAIVKKTLSLSSADWSSFGQLANNEPVQEGRHRGKHAGLRPATKSETEWALKFAQELIELYVTRKANGANHATR